MTTSDIITELGKDDDLNDHDFVVVKHWDSHDERVYFPDFDSFITYVFDLDMHGWELSGFRKIANSKHSDTCSFSWLTIYVEFSIEV